MPKRRVTELWIYPVKSLGGIRISSASVREKGLRHDRRWMLIDEQGKFLTQRNMPGMALFSMALDDELLVVSHQGDQLELPMTWGAGTSVSARIWNDTVTVTEAPAQYHHWFSDRLGLTCRLVSFPEEQPRLIDPAFRPAHENVSLADGYPILVIGQASLDDLNARLEQPVPMNRFRPNVVFAGGDPYEEDNWKNFRVGSNRMLGVKPCGRCVLTTVDQETGIAGKEPLLTLSRYRRMNDRICFGQNVIPRDYHEIHEGDEIVLE